MRLKMMGRCKKGEEGLLKIIMKRRKYNSIIIIIMNNKVKIWNLSITPTKTVSPQEGHTITKETPNITISTINNINKTLLIQKTSFTKRQLAHHHVSHRTFITHKIYNHSHQLWYQNKTQDHNIKLHIKTI